MHCADFKVEWAGEVGYELPASMVALTATAVRFFLLIGFNTFLS